ncbi:Homeobox protein Nkx-6.1 [Bienertia sinuspersici]
MKGSKFASQPVVSNYEIQRLEKLRQNAKLMEAKGHGKDSLANKILESNAQIHFQNSRVEDIYSDEDEMYTPDEEEESEKEQHEEEDEDDSNVLEQPTSKKLPKTMSSFVAKHVNQPRKEVATIVSPMTRSGSMAESLKQVAQSQQKQKAHNFEHKKQQQQPTSKKNGLQSQKVQQPKKYCTPGSMSHFRDLRMKQLRNSIALTNTEVPCNNDDEGVEGQHSSYAPNEAPDYEPFFLNVGSKLTKHRGPTKLLNVHARTSEERKLVVLNSFGQPVGPTRETVKEFRGFLGTIARNSKLAPLNYCDWPSVPSQDTIWKYILERYIVAEEGRKCILEIVGARWRGYKCWVKKHQFYAYETYEKRWEKRPQTIPDAQFKDLLDYWDFELVKELSDKNKSNRLKADDMHTLGPNSYALLRHELQQEDPNKEPPSQAKVYIKSRTRNPKRKYKTSYQKTKQNMVSWNASTTKSSVGGPSSVAADSLHQKEGEGGASQTSKMLKLTVEGKVAIPRNREVANKTSIRVPKPGG